MPNWCENVLIIRGQPDLLQALEASVVADDVVFSFSTIDPEPAEMSDGRMRYSETAEYSALLDQYNALGDDAKRAFLLRNEGLRGVLQAAAFQHPEEASDASEYWRDQHWGTKWDLDADSISCIGEPGKLSYAFSTAWRAPLPVIKTLAARHPDLDFELVFTPELQTSAGHISFSSGEETAFSMALTRIPKQRVGTWLGVGWG